MSGKISMRFCIFSCMKNIFRSLIQPWAAIPCIALGLCCIPAHHLAAQTSPQRGNKIAVKHVNSISIDHDNTKWFSTDVGIVSFDGIDWKLHKDVTGMPDKVLPMRIIRKGRNSGLPHPWVQPLPGCPWVNRQKRILSTLKTPPSPARIFLVSQQVRITSAGSVQIREYGP